MKYDFIVFGGTGLQGKICARDLLESGYRIMLVGRDTRHIQDLLKNKRVGFTSVDLRDSKSITKVIRQSGADVVVNCAELIFNVPIMKACLQTKKSCTDLGGLQEVTIEQFKLHEQFKRAGITNITGCGSTPGIANVMAAHAVNQFESVDTIALGFAWDSNIKTFVIPYSMQSIFDEFTQEPVTFHDGTFVKENQMMCQGTFNFKEIGRQTAYCIVHSEVYTFSKYFKDKGLRHIHYMAGFPEHSMKVIRMLMDLQFDDTKLTNVHGLTITPLEFTLEVLKHLKTPKGYREIENLWVQVTGKKDGEIITSEMNCIVKTVKGWEEAGSNIDTGRTISIMSQMLKKKIIQEKGVFGPEAVIPQHLFFEELAKRKMWVYQDGKKIN